MPPCLRRVPLAVRRSLAARLLTAPLPEVFFNAARGVSVLSTPVRLKLLSPRWLSARTSATRELFALAIAVPAGRQM